MKNKIHYIATAKNGLESFVFNEFAYLFDRRNLTLYLIENNYSGSFSPKEDWPVKGFNIMQIVFYTPYIILTNTFKFIRLLCLAIRSATIVEFLIACLWSKDVSRSDLIFASFADRKLFIGFYIKEFTQAKLVTRVHAHEIYVNPNERFFREIIPFVDEFYPISRLNMDVLINRFSVPKANISLMRLGIDNVKFQPIDYDSTILMVGRWVERKGHRLLFEAIKGINVRVVVIGFGPIDISDLSKRMGVQDKVVVFDKMNADQLSFFYNHCDVFCLPSVSTEREGSEGIPVVLMEAMAAGCEIVASDDGSITELPIEFIFKQNCVDDLRQKLREAMNSKQRRYDYKNFVMREHNAAENNKMLNECLQKFVG